MKADDEIRLYLRSLLEHPVDCRSEGCSWCVALQGVMESVRGRIFSGRIFPVIASSKPESREQQTAREHSVLTT